MQTLEERAQSRRNSKIPFVKHALHDSSYHSFHPELPLEEAWELLAKLSHESFFSQTGAMPQSGVDKQVVRIISLSEKV